MRSVRHIGKIVFAMLAAGCDRGAPLAGPVVIAAAPVHVAFATPITPAGPDRAVCLDFERPDDSRRAADVTVVLLTAQGDRDTLRGRIDRAGEASVCLRDTNATAATQTYTSAELSAPMELRVHRVSWAAPRAELPQPAPVESCFLLYELSVGEVGRNPSEACRVRITPASTFKVPHALAALDAGVVTSTEVFRYDGTGDWPESARRDHTLVSAIRHSVLWYFQRVAQRLGAEREKAYLQKLAFGNMDSSSALTSFWVGGSLQITPEEQQSFWVKLYENKLPIAPAAVATVKEMLIQPRGVIVNAAGQYAFDAPWPADTIVSAKTGSAADRSGRGARWLIGHIKKGGRQFIFVTCVIGPRDLDANAATVLAERSLREAQVL